MAEDRRPVHRPREDLRVARGDGPAAQGPQAGLRRIDHRRRAAVSAGRGLRPDRHAAVGHVDRAGRAGRSDLLQGAAGQAGAAIRRPANGQVQGRRRTADAHRNEQAAPRKPRRRGRRHLRTTWCRRSPPTATEGLQVKTHLDQGLFTAAGRQEGRADRRRALRGSASGRDQKGARSRRSTSLPTTRRNASTPISPASPA